MIYTYAVYRNSDGEVLRSGSVGSSDQIATQAQAGETAISDPDPEVTADGLWRWTGSAFEQDPIPEPTLAELQATAHATVKTLRESHEQGGCDTPSGRIQSDADSQRKVSGAVQMAMILGDAFSIVWRMEDNSLVTLDAAGMTAMGLAVGNHVNLCQQRKNDLDEAIDAAADAAALEAIDLEAGWP